MSITLSDAFIEDFDDKVDEGNVEQGITNSETELSVINEVEEDIINNTIESVEYTEDEVLTNDNASIISDDAIENGDEENAIVQDENVVNYDIEQPANANTPAITILPTKRRAKGRNTDETIPEYINIGNIVMRSKHDEILMIPVEIKNISEIEQTNSVELFVDNILYSNKITLQCFGSYVGCNEAAIYNIKLKYLNKNNSISEITFQPVQIPCAGFTSIISEAINDYVSPIDVTAYMTSGNYMDYGLTFATPFITMVFNKDCTGTTINNIYYFGSTFDVYVPDNGKAIRDNNGNTMNYQIEMRFTFSVITGDEQIDMQPLNSISEREIEIKNGTYQFCSENTCNSENEIMFHDNGFSFFPLNGDTYVTLKDVKVNMELLNGIETERYKNNNGYKTDITE